MSAVPLIAAVATIVLLFTGGAGDWFKRVGSDPGGPGGYPGAPYGGQYGPSAAVRRAAGAGRPSQYPSPQDPPAENPYGQSPSGPDPYGQQPPSSDNPYGQQPPSEGGSEYPPRDYPNR